MTIRTTNFAFCVAWLLSFPLIAFAQDAGDKPPDLGALAAMGRANLERLGKQAATWTTTTHLSRGARVFVEILASPTMRRTVLSLEAQGRRGEVLRIIERDGSWYVTEGGKAEHTGPTRRRSTCLRHTSSSCAPSRGS